MSFSEDDSLFKFIIYQTWKRYADSYLWNKQKDKQSVRIKKQKPNTRQKQNKIWELALTLIMFQM